MKNHFTKMLGFCCALALIFGNYSNVAAQCTNAAAFGTVTAPTSNTPLTISTCSYLIEYSTINAVQAGSTYSLSVSAAAGMGYVTVHSGTPTGPVIAQGMSPLSVTPAAAGTIYAHWTVDAACVTETGVCRVSTITCTSCSAPPNDCLGVPGGPAVPGTACNDGNPNTVNDLFQPDCSCVGVAPAANDLCANAININCGQTRTGSTANASADVAPFCVTGDGTGGGVWYKHTATTNNTVRASLCGSDYDSKVRVFSGPCNALVCVGGNDDNFAACGDSDAQVEFAAVAGTQYYILVHGFSTAVGNFNLELTCNVVVPIDCNGVPNGPAVPGTACDDMNPATLGDVFQADCSCAGSLPPANDDKCMAFAIACGDSVMGSNLAASVDTTVAAPSCATGSLKDLWYSLAAQAGVTYNVTVNGADYDGVLAAYTGNCNGTLTEIACSDSGFTAGIAEFIDITVATNQTVLIRTYDWGADGGSFTLSVDVDGGCPTTGCNVDGGTIATTNSTSVCVGTGTPKFISVSLTGAVGPNKIWAITNLSGDVIATRTANANFNLDIYPAGDYRINHMSYDNTVNLMGVTNASQLSGCFDVSNPILIRLRPQPDGGTISTTSPTTVCVGNGVADIVSLTRTGLVGESSAYGVLRVSTNTVVASQSGPNFNFDGYAPGVYRIYSIAFQAGATVAGVTTPAGLAGCYDLSNFVQVTAQNCAPAVMTTSPNPTTGQSFVTFSVANEEYTTVEVYDMSGRQITSLFNQVVEKDVEYRLEFDGQALPNGIYIYRLTTGSEVVIEKFMIAK